MAANNTFSGTADGTMEFPRPINYLNINVATGAVLSFSVDGSNYVSLPVGFHSFRVGTTTTIYISSTGAWQAMGIQA